MSNKITGNRVTFPLFEIVSNPTINITQVKQRRFNLVDRDLGEPTVERIIDDLLLFRRREGGAAAEYEMVREYIIKHLRKYKTFENLREAVKEVAPEFEPIVDRLGVLK